MIGLSTSGSISLGIDLVAGKKRVPKPAAGKTALRTLFFIVRLLHSPFRSMLRSRTATEDFTEHISGCLWATLLCLFVIYLGCNLACGRWLRGQIIEQHAQFCKDALCICSAQR